MALPGFNAENSLYKTNGQYRVTRGRTQREGIVFPAQANRTTCDTYDVTVTDCCSPESSYSDCWKCTRTGPDDIVYHTWFSGTCQPLPLPTTTPKLPDPVPDGSGRGGGKGPTGPEKSCYIHGMPVACEQVDQCLQQGTCEVVYKRR